MIILLGYAFHISFALLFLFLCLAFITGAPFVPTRGNAAKKMIDLAQISSKDVVYDLGSGDGRLLFLAAQKGAKKVIGLEINPFLVFYTNIRIFLSPYRHIISCKVANFWTHNIADSDVTFVYLLPWKMDTLSKKLEKELKPGSRVVSNSFIFPKWKKKASDEALHVYAFEVGK